MLDKLKNLCKAIKERKLWPVIAVIAFLSSVFLFYWIDYVGPKAKDFVLAETNMNNEEAQYVIGEIYAGDVIEQQIPVDVDIYGIGFSFATYERVNSCTISIEVYDENDICLFTKNLSAEELKDNAFYDFIFDEKIRPADTDFIRVIITSPDGEPGNAITLYSSLQEEVPGRILYVNEEGTSTNLTFRLLGNQKYSILGWMFLSFYLISVSLVLLVYLFMIKKVPLEKVFIIAAVLLGIISNAVFPPKAIPDEAVHINTAYHYSNLLLGKGSSESEGTLYMRQGDAEIFKALKADPVKDTYWEISEQNDLFMSEEERQLIPVDAKIVDTTFTQYIFPSIGLTIARIFHIQTIPALYLGRFFNLACYIFFIYWAIRKTPVAKLTFFVAGLLPMAVHIAASFSYDASTIGISFLFIGWMLDLIYQKEPVKKADVIICGCLAFFLPQNKLVYTVLIGLCFLIAKEKWSGFRKIKTCALWIGLSLSGLLLSYSGRIIDEFNRETESWHPSKGAMTYSFSWVLENFWEALQMGVRTLVETGSWYWQTMIGSSLSWLNVPVHGYLILVLTVCLFLSVFPIKEKNEVLVARKQKIWISMILFCGIVLIILSMLNWTNVGSDLFQGIQGRYFLPILPLFLLMFRGKGIILEKHVPTVIAVTTVTVTAFAFLESFSYIIQR